MHELLEPAAPNRDAAFERCRRYLRRRCLRRAAGAGAWRLLAFLAPARTRAELVVLAAWFTLVDELAGEERGLVALRRELDAVAAGEPTCALGAALRPALERLEVPAGLLRRPLTARERARHVRVLETRAELVQRATELAAPEAGVWLRALAVHGDREALRADKLAVAVQCTRWLSNLLAELSRGYLRVPMSELREAGLSLDTLLIPRSERAHAFLLDQVARTRIAYAHGWALCEVLGPVRGRLLAFFLRWHAAALAGLEARGYDPAKGAPPAGLVRLGACAVAALGSRRCPFPSA